MKALKETIAIAALTLPLAALASEPAKVTLSLRQFTVYDTTLKDFPGAKFNSEAVPELNPNYWLPSISEEGANNSATYRALSKDRTMAIEFFEDPSKATTEVLTWRKDTDNKNHGALTVFKGHELASHTFSHHGAAATLTKEVCELLRSQSNAKSLSEFAEKAQTCDAFYRMKAIPVNLRDALKDYKSTHDSNVKKLHSSFAKDAFPVPAPAPTKEKKTTDILGEFVSSILNGKQVGQEVTPQPHSQVKSLDLFSLKASGSDGNYRATLSDIAQKCVQFFAAPAATAPAPATGRSDGKATAK